ncbi:unnamed protein product [Candida verbasci]|uniref:rRNA adenine N(6)-methyltransferase n=1 Tax=Candida verbasci TaxID=1227364 RepID=A0A9W4XFL1_9ASCO|nr:unnamed protein product [Candida verbasci]
MIKIRNNLISIRCLTLRSINPNIPVEFYKDKQTVGKDRAHVDDPESIQKIIDKLDIKLKYGSNLTIIDTNPGRGIWSTMLNYELKPKNHLLLEPSKINQKMWKKLLESINSNEENFNLLSSDYAPYSWKSYKLIEEQYNFNKLGFEKENDELLVLGNWTGAQDEPTIAQWIGCLGARNWLIKYGRVRILMFMPSKTAGKFLSEPNFHRRNRTSMKRELFTKSRLIAIGDDTTGSATNKDYIAEGFDPEVMVRDQPILIPGKGILKNRSISLVEFIPGDYTIDDIQLIDNNILSLLYLSNATLGETIPKIGPGAEYLLTKLPQHILEKDRHQFSAEDLIKFTKAVEEWPFRPSLEDTNDLIIPSEY